MAVAVDAFSLPLAEPLTTADGAIESRSGFLVRVREDGVVGIGEATPLPGWTESLDECREALASIVDAPAGGDAIPEHPTDDGGAAECPSDSGGFQSATWHPLATTPSEAGPDALLDRLDGTPAARHGLSLALADLRARRARQPLCDVLGDGAVTDPVLVNATIGSGDPETTATAASRAVDAGFDVLKVKVGARTPSVDRERIERVRAALGDDAALRVDANGAWDRATASAALEWLADFGVTQVEQPLPADDLQGHAALAGGQVDVALDESLVEFGADALLDADAGDVLVVKPMAVGGLDRAAAAVERARDAGWDAVLTTTIDAVVARTGLVHLAATVPELPACGLATADRLERDLASDPAPVCDGRIAVPDGPGLGIDPAAVGLD